MAVVTRELEQLHGSEVAPSPWEQGDPEAFERIYHAYRDRLFRFCYSKLRDAHEAEDVTQETFARAWRTQVSFADEARCYAWLRVVAGNLCTDLLRRRGRCQTAAEVEPGTTQGADDLVMRAGDTELVRRAMGRLNDRHRAALEQRETAGWTYEQMASHAGITISSVESLLWRARQALKRELVTLAGPDGILAGVPLIGVVVRSLHSAKARLTAWVSHWGTLPQVAAGAALAIGSGAAVYVAGLEGSAAPSPAARVPAAVVYVAPAAPPAAAASTPPTTAAALPTSSVASPARGAGPASAAPAQRPGQLENPITSTRPDNQRDKSMPLSAAVGPDSLGVDPPGLATYAGKLVADQATNALTGGANP